MKLKYLDMCNSQYFSGHNLPVVQVLIGNKTTSKQLKEELLSYQATAHLEELNREDYKLAVEEFFERINFNESYIVDPSLDSMDYDYDYDCYAYFIIEDSGLGNYK